MKKVIINTIGGVIQEVLSENPDLQIILLDFDDHEHDSQIVSEHYVSNVLNNLEFKQLPLDDYVTAMMPKPEMTHHFHFSMAGLDREEALKKLIASLCIDHVQETEGLELDCALCGKTVEIDPNNCDFSPELYWRDVQIGDGVCAVCQVRHCTPDHVKGGFDLQITSLQWSDYPKDTALVRYMERKDPIGGNE